MINNQAELRNEAFKIKTEKEYERKIESLVKKGLLVDKELAEYFDSLMPEEAFNPLNNDIITDLKH